MYMIKGDYGFEAGVPTVTAVDNGNGTATITCTDPGSQYYILSWGETAQANTTVTRVDDGIFTTPQYSVDKTIYFKVKAVGANGIESEFSAIDSILIDIVDAATPVATPAAGAVPIGTEVVLTCASPGATIYYTLDDSTPDNTDAKYTAPIKIDEAVTIKAKAYAPGFDPSAVLTAAYTIALAATPVAAPEGGAVELNTEIILTCATPGAKIYFTIDGSTPDDDSTLYEGGNCVMSEVGGMTLKAIAYHENYEPSLVLEEVYTLAT